MLWSLIATLVAGFAGAGIGLAINRLSGRRTPAWLTPVLAGAAMIAATVGQEYAWYSNTLDTMGEVEIIAENEQQTWWQPWTYIQPFVRSFVAYDPAEVVALEGETFVVQTILQQRWQPRIQIPTLVDCAEGRRAEVTPDVVVAEDGTVTGAPWIDVAEGDPILNVVCGREAAGQS